jgi:uncharacterized membrane protein YhhN
LLGAWAGVLIAAFAFGKYNLNRTRHDVRPLLMATSALLVVMAALFWLGGARGGRAEPYSLLIAFGMAVSFLGDLLMAEYIPSPNRVVFGGAAFVLAHMLYIFASSAALAALGVGREAGPVVGLLVVGIGLWAAFVRSSQTPGAMNGAMLVYMLVISTMTGLAAALALAAPGLWPLALGALLFLASDVVLLNHIARRNDWFLVSDVVWVLYIIGQALIVWSNLPALALIA